MVQKKMVYSYLNQYAPLNHELSVLAINTMLKDCNDVDPLVRGMALRNLASLRYFTFRDSLSLALCSHIIALEYPASQTTWKPLRQGMSDPSPYVRKTAVLGCLKLFHLAPHMVRGAFVPFLPSSHWACIHAVCLSLCV